jgi:hypothetical protein
VGCAVSDSGCWATATSIEDAPPAIVFCKRNGGQNGGILIHSSTSPTKRLRPQDLLSCTKNEPLEPNSKLNGGAGTPARSGCVACAPVEHGILAEADVDTAYISALSALGGATIGGLASFGSSWLTQRTQLRFAHYEPDLTAEKLLEHSRLPLVWHDQRIVLGFA